MYIYQLKTRNEFKKIILVKKYILKKFLKYFARF